MVTVINLLIVGIANGAIYALVALGYTMVYGIIELINFAHGDVFMVGTFLTITILGWLGVNEDTQINSFNVGIIAKLVLTFIGAFLLCALLGVLIERVAYRPLRNAPKLAPLISAIGVSLVLQDSGQLWKGSNDIPFPNYPFGVVQIGAFRVQDVDIIVLVCAVILMISLNFLISSTRIGRAMRAVAQDRDAASLMGVNVNRIISFTFFIGAGLAGAAAFIYSMKYTNTTFNVGFKLGLYAFTCAVLGGIGNIIGAMVGGLIIGVIESMVTLIPNSVLPNGGDAWVNAFIFAILILILVFRPSGLFGQNTPEKV